MAMIKPKNSVANRSNRFSGARRVDDFYSSWSVQLPPDMTAIGISRGVPRNHSGPFGYANSNRGLGSIKSLASTCPAPGAHSNSYIGWRGMLWVGRVLALSVFYVCKT